MHVWELRGGMQFRGNRIFRPILQLHIRGDEEHLSIRRYKWFCLLWRRCSCMRYRGHGDQRECHSHNVPTCQTICKLWKYALLIRCSEFLEGCCRYRVILDRNFDCLTRAIVRNLQLTKVHLWGKKQKFRMSYLGIDGEQLGELRWDYVWRTLLPLRCSELSVQKLCVWRGIAPKYLYSQGFSARARHKSGCVSKDVGRGVLRRRHVTNGSAAHQSGFSEVAFREPNLSEICWGQIETKVDILRLYRS